MIRLFSLMFVCLTTLFSAEISTDHWDEVKRKISLVHGVTDQARTKACEAIDLLKNGKDAQTIYSCVQGVTDINILPNAILKTVKLIKKLDQREERIVRILEGIVDPTIKSEAKAAIDQSLISDRLATARAWKYLAGIEDEIIRGRVAKAVEKDIGQNKPSIAGICWNLTSFIDEYVILKQAVDTVIATPQKDRATAMNVWVYIVAIENSIERANKISILKMFIQKEKQGDQPTDWPAFLRILVEGYEN